MFDEVKVVKKKEKPFISVIIPTYNRAKELKRAVESVLNQDYTNFDLWIIDDGSTDETSKLIEHFQISLSKEVKDFKPIIHYIKTANQGVSAARNVGIKHSKSDWCAFLDSDDEWLKDKLSRQVEFSLDNPEIRIVHGEEIWVRRGKRVNQKKIHQKSGGRIFQRCLKLCLISPSAVMIERGLLEEMNGFDENFVVCEDYDLWLKITSKYEVGYIKEPLITKYGGHDDQLSHKFKAMDYFRVKSIHNLLKSSKIDGEDKQRAEEEIVRKADILLLGYKKHNNLEHFDEIKKIKMIYQELMD